MFLYNLKKLTIMPVSQRKNEVIQNTFKYHYTAIQHG